MNKIIFKIKKAFEWLFPKKITKKHITIDEESVKKHDIIKGMANQMAELKGKIAKYEMEEGKRREKEKDKKEEEEVKIFLDKKKKEIVRKTTPKYYSLKTFFNKSYKDKKFRDKIAFYSFDRSKKIAKFGDFGLCSDGDFALLDEDRNLIIKMPKLNDIFQSVGALSNDISSFKIPLNMDSDGGYIENIMTYEAPEIINTGKEMRFMKARKRPVYEIIRDLNEEKSEILDNLREQEALNIEQKNKMGKLEMEIDNERKSAEILRTELSKNKKRYEEIEKNNSNMEKELVNLRQIKEINEEYLHSLESELEKIRKKAEREGRTPSFEDAIQKIDLVKDTIREKRREIVAPTIETQKESVKKL